jgi:hypothetical protein
MREPAEGEGGQMIFTCPICKVQWDDPDLVGRSVLKKTCPECRRKHGIRVTGHGYVGQVKRQMVGGAKTR